LVLKAREREPKTLEEALNIVVRLEAYATARTDDTTSEGRLRQHRNARQVVIQKVDETGNGSTMDLLVTEMQKMNQKLNSLSIATPAPNHSTHRVVSATASLEAEPSQPATKLQPTPLFGNRGRARTKPVIGKGVPATPVVK